LLIDREDGYYCPRCDQIYVREGESYLFRHDASDHLRESREGLILRLKALVKKFPWVFTLLTYWAGAFVGKSAKQAIGHLVPTALVVNLGSGVRQVRSGVVNVDYDHFPGVQIVADVTRLPFQSGTVDAVVSESLFEHLNRPNLAVAEARRVLKPGGFIYVVTPFMLGYHASPSDYYRWTEFGMAELLEGFTIKESGIAWGPTVALASIGGNWLALVFSFGSSWLFQFWSVFFMFLFGPFTYIDYLLARHTRSREIAHGFYFVATKK
jgi:SAM-dependent methyltransferase